MILCACPTTTIERNWIIPNFSIGGFYRVQKELLFAAGKGVNVARVIQKLGGEATCAGFVGGYSGPLFQSLIENEAMRGSWTAISGDTRLSITVYDPQNTSDATSFCDYGPTITANEWHNFSADLMEASNNAENVSISGSIPPGILVEQFSELVSELRQAGKKVWLDLSGPWLAAGARANPFAIKVNAKEMSELVDRSVHTNGEVLEASRKFRQTYPIAIVIVTLGPEGSVCSSKWGDWIIHPVHFARVVSSIGCGDSYLGGLLVKYAEGSPLEECLRSASAAAAANTQKLGPGVFEIEDYQAAMKMTSLDNLL